MAFILQLLVGLMEHDTRVFLTNHRRLSELSKHVITLSLKVIRNQLCFVPVFQRTMLVLELFSKTRCDWQKFISDVGSIRKSTGITWRDRMYSVEINQTSRVQKLSRMPCAKPNEKHFSFYCSFFKPRRNCAVYFPFQLTSMLKISFSNSTMYHNVYIKQMTK